MTIVWDSWGSAAPDAFTKDGIPIYLDFKYGNEPTSLQLQIYQALQNLSTNKGEMSNGVDE